MSSRAKRAKAPRAKRRGGFSRFLRAVLLLAIWGGVALLALIAYFAYDLPDVTQVAEPGRRPSLTLTAPSGEIIATFGNLYREAVPLNEMSPYLPKAVIAIEDRRFYSHFGIDPLGILRAAWVNWRAGRVVQGGSTITQQLAKNLFLGPQKTLRRKVQEVLLALYLEQKFDKDRILAAYLNRVYLGSGTYGVEAASRRYFGKSARDLNLAEAAMIAGLLKAPSRYSPANDLARSRRRAAQVLDAMVAAGMIDENLAARAKASPARLRRRAGVSADIRYFADWVADETRALIGSIDRDLIVTTTLNPRLQDLAQQTVRKALKPYPALQVAMMALAPDGAIAAMIGGRDYRRSQFNRATQARRQPGSAFKPIVYLAALETGYRPDDIIEDSPLSIGDWVPKNYDGKFKGAMTLTDALAQSRNLAAVRLYQQVGGERVIDLARRLGIVSPLRDHPSLALGTSEVTPLEIVTAYAHFANGGRVVVPYGITEIRDRAGRVLYRRQKGGLGRAVAPLPVRNLVGMLEQVIENGTGRRARIGRPAAGKTGTTQDNRDAWFVGFTPELVAGIWIGKDKGTPMKNVSGGSLPARIWARFMKAALKGTAPRDFAWPADGPGEASRDAGESRDREGSSPDYRSIWKALIDRLGSDAADGEIVPEYPDREGR